MAVFVEASRVLTSLTAPLEKRCLIWLAQRMPSWVNSDHLTALALASMFLAGASYTLASVSPVGLVLVVPCLALNWFGDSLDGTLARVRGHQRPRYGFYVDHIVDAAGTTALLGGLALSGYMSPLIALGLLIGYLLVSIEAFLATHCLGSFTLSFMKLGPTELRILLAIGTVTLLVHPQATIAGYEFQLFDVGGLAGIVGLTGAFVTVAIRNTRALYRAEPLPGSKR